MTEGARYKVNNAYLEEKEGRDSLENVWCRLPQFLGFFGKMRWLLQWYRGFCIDKAKARRTEEVEL
jgi:hypothetical protein